MRKVNEDGTYDVYFPEDSEKFPNVPECDIKTPITSGKTTQRLSKYVGKVFFDEGSDGTDPNEPYFQPGEFIVEEIVEKNNFLCRATGDDDDRLEEFDIGHVIKCIRKYEEE